MIALRTTILLIISIIQIDYVILSAIYYQAMSIIITNSLLKLKKFEDLNNIYVTEFKNLNNNGAKHMEKKTMQHQLHTCFPSFRFIIVTKLNYKLIDWNGVNTLLLSSA